MDWITGMQKAIDYIEDNITDKLDYEQIAVKAHVSSFHFQRMFSILCGYPLGEYIRNRRLTLAGNELSFEKAKVIDTAIKYGYESPDSFAKAFTRFHGITPSAAREPGANLKSFGRLFIKISLEGGSILNYRIEEKPAAIFVGHKMQCEGNKTDPADNYNSTYKHWISSRDEQKTMKGIRNEPTIWYDIYSNFSDDGFKHYIAIKTDEIEIPVQLEAIDVPACTYAIFETTKRESPEEDYIPLLKRIVSEWLPTSGFILSNKPLINVVHWNKTEDDNDRYFELWLPIEKQ